MEAQVAHCTYGAVYIPLPSNLGSTVKYQIDLVTLCYYLEGNKNTRSTERP